MDKIRIEIYKWIVSSEVCTEIRMAMNKVKEKGIVPKGSRVPGGRYQELW